jgi:hypothetical protein
MNVSTPLGDVEVLCRDCICFVKNEKSLTGGNCHAHPPQILTLTKPNALTGRPEPAFNAMFAPVPSDAWCREFSPSPSLLELMKLNSEGNG